MKMDYERAFEYVEQIFKNNPHHKAEYRFRDRMEHTRRVFMWAKRLLKEEKADETVVLMSVIFHDVGYVVSPKEHSIYSAKMCREYLEGIGCEQSFIQQVCQNIENHKKKEIIHQPETSMEQILLIEADCLDESGVMSMIRDGIIEGISGGHSYKAVYESMCQRKIYSDNYQYHCVTKTGLALIKEKQRLYKELMQSLKQDLYEDV